MFRVFTMLAALWWSTAFGQPTPVAPNVAGKVEFVEGDVQFLDASQRERRPQVGEPVNERESIITGKDGEVHLQMEDGGFIAVRPATRMRIVNYRAEGGADDRSLINLLEGSFRSITGWIGKYSPRNYAVQTPTATIGVRGTDHEPHVIPEGSSLGQPGTYDKVNVGGTTISGKQGTIDVAPGRAGFFPIRSGERPRVLESVPSFFRPTRHEARFENRHAEIQRVLGERRDDRRKLIEQRRTEQGGRREELDQRRKDGKGAKEKMRPDGERKAGASRREHEAQRPGLRERQEAEGSRSRELQDRKRPQLEAQPRETRDRHNPGTRERGARDGRGEPQRLGRDPRHP